MCGLVSLAMTWYEDQFKSHHTWLPVSAETDLGQTILLPPALSPLGLLSQHLPQAQQGPLSEPFPAEEAPIPTGLSRLVQS